MRALLVLLALLGASAHADPTLLNVSYDPTRELYQEIDRAFARVWRARTGQAITVEQSHGGSGKQARAVIEGLPADVVTLALGYDVDAIVAHAGLLPASWRDRLPSRSAPFTSTIVFVVRRGNPRGIRDWDDLARPGVGVVVPNPKVSGGARWAYLGAWAWASRAFGGDEARMTRFVGRVYRNAPIMDSGARASTTTFAQRGLGDVLVAWESEAALVQREFPDDGYELVRPSVSILAETPVALVDRNVDQHGTRAAAQAYLEFLYSDEAQEIAARHHLRPSNPVIAARHPELPPMQLVTVGALCGDWEAAQRRHFSDGGLFDRIFDDPRTTIAQRGQP